MSELLQFARSLPEQARNHAQETMQQLARTIVDRAPITTPREFETEYRTHILNGKVPVLISNHQAHADGLGMIKVARTLNNILNPFVPNSNSPHAFDMIVAKTFTEGTQNPFLKFFWDSLHPLFTESEISTIGITRDKDVQKYGIPKNNTAAFLQLFRDIKQGKGIILFPEATIEGGRHDRGSPRETIHGMQPFEPESLPSLLALFDKAGKKPIIIPVGTHGSFRILDTQTHTPTQPFLKSILNGDSLITLSLGMPIDPERLKESLRMQEIPWEEGLNQFVGKTIASLLPEQAQGVYGNKPNQEHIVFAQNSDENFEDYL